MLKRVLIKNLKPNPFRRLGEYPILRKKIDALKESYESTGFWSNINGRAGPSETIEIAYGHHRLQALLEVYGEDHAVEIIVKDLSNDDMLRMMARENMEEWGSSAWVEMETVRATIEAAARGEIIISRPKGQGRRDPDREVRLGLDAPFRYHAADIAIYLGWTKKDHDDGLRPDKKCEVAFLCLDAIDKGDITEDEIKGLSRGDAEYTVRKAMATRENELAAAREREDVAAKKRARASTTEDPAARTKAIADAEILERNAASIRQEADAKARKVASEGAEKIQGGHGRKGVDDLAARVQSKRRKPRPKPKREMTTWEGMAVRLKGFIDAVPSAEITSQTDDIISHMNDVDDDHVRLLKDAIGLAIKRLQGMQQRLETARKQERKSPRYPKTGGSNGRQRAIAGS